MLVMCEGIGKKSVSMIMKQKTNQNESWHNRLHDSE